MLIYAAFAKESKKVFSKIMKKTKDNQEDYPKEAYELLFKIESTHFWFWGRNEIIKTVIQQAIKKTRGLRFLEIGCGTGYVLSLLEKLGFKTTGVDLHPEGLKLARTRTKAVLISGDLKKISFKTKFEAVGLFDVLEHIKDQKSFLKDCCRFLKPQGFLFLTVPVKMRLWSKMDEISGHKRRYDQTEIIKLLQETGYKVERINYFNFFLFLPQLIFRKYQDRKITSLQEGLKPPRFFLNQFFKLVFFLENKLINFISFPFGASLIVVARMI